MPTLLIRPRTCSWGSTRSSTCDFHRYMVANYLRPCLIRSMSDARAARDSLTVVPIGFACERETCGVAMENRHYGSRI